MCFSFSFDPLRFSLLRESDEKMIRSKSWAIVNNLSKIAIWPNWFFEKLVLVHTLSFWNINIQWTSHHDLAEKCVSLVSIAKLVICQKFKTALYDLTKKTASIEFCHQAVWIEIWHKFSNQSGGQTQKWKKENLLQLWGSSLPEF